MSNGSMSNESMSNGSMVKWEHAKWDWRGVHPIMTITISQGGALPNIQAVLLPKKSGS